jgi:hypothetical protein
MRITSDTNCCFLGRSIHESVQMSLFSDLTLTAAQPTADRTSGSTTAAFKKPKASAADRTSGSTTAAFKKPKASAEGVKGAGAGAHHF